MTDWEAIRKNYPLVENCTYFGTPLLGAISRATHQKAQSYWEEFLYDGPLNYDAWAHELKEARASAGKLINASPNDIAFLGDVATGMNFLSSLLQNTSREIILYEGDFPSVALPWQNHHHRILKIPASSRGIITPELVEEMITPDTGVLVLSFVQFNTGYKIDLEAIGQLCRDRGILFVVDATQGLGALRVDVQEQRIDVLLASTYKWVLGGYGTAIFYARPGLIGERIPAVGWHSLTENTGIPDLKNIKRSPEALEIGHPKFSTTLVSGAAINELLGLGIAAIEERIASLTKQLHLGLKEKGIRVLSDFEEKNLSGISMIPGTEQQVQELKRKRIHCSYRGNSIRLGLHFYNNEQDIEHLLSEL